MKKIMRYLFNAEPELTVACEALLRAQHSVVTPDEMLEMLCEQVGRHWKRKGGGPTRLVSYNHMTKTLVQLR